MTCWVHNAQLLGNASVELGMWVAQWQQARLARARKSQKTRKPPELGVVVHSCIPSTRVAEFKACLSYKARPCLKKVHKKNP
jgi:hypothetical protein